MAMAAPIFLSLTPPTNRTIYLTDKAYRLLAAAEREDASDRGDRMSFDDEQRRACAMAGPFTTNQAVDLLTDFGRFFRPRRTTIACSAHCLRAVAFAVSLTTVVALVSQAQAASPGDATSSRAARDEAIRAIPWRNMAPADRQRAQSVIKNTSIYRRLPTRVIDCDPDMFAFLIAHPEVVIDVWQLMGISRLTVDKLPDGSYRGTDGAGTTGNVRYLHNSSTPDGRVLTVVYANGAYDGKPFPTTLKAQSILVLRSSAIQETNGRRYITVCVDSFVAIEQMGFEIVAKTVQPWLNKTADRNFIETLSFISNFSRTAEKNPQGMQRLATRLPSIDDPTRTRLVQICYRAADRYAQRAGASPTSANLLARHRDTMAYPK
jgi:hypothetical protein